MNPCFLAVHISTLKSVIKKYSGNNSKNKNNLEANMK